MLKLKKDFKCVLCDKKTGNSLLEFDAQQVGDPIYGAGFEGGGVASGNQAMTIMTEKKYQYNALQNNVMIDGKRWIITSVVPSVRRKLGAGIGTKVRNVYILTLE
jgi:hypothetical protein